MSSSTVKPFTAAVLTVSDSCARGEKQDLSGPAAREELEKIGCEVTGIHVVRDELSEIQESLIRFSDLEDIDLVVTTGGTGLAPTLLAASCA